MRRALAVLFLTLGFAVAHADESKLPPITKSFRQSQRARLAAVLGDYDWKHATEVNLLGFTADGRSVIAGDERSVVVRECAGGREGRAFDAPGPRALSADGSKLAVVGDELVCVEPTSGKKLWSKAGRFTAVRFAKSGARLLAVSGATATILDAAKGKEVRTLRAESTRLGALSPDGELAVLGDARKLTVYSVAHMKKVATLASDAPLTALVWDEVGLVTGAEDGKVRSWSVEKAKPLWEQAHSKPIVALAAAGTRLVALSADGSLVVRDAKGVEIAKVSDPGARACALAADGFNLATAGFMVRLWSFETKGRIVGSDVGHEGPILAVALSPDKKQLLTTSTDHTARLWPLAPKLEKRVLDLKSGSVGACAFSPDGEQALTASDDGSLELWDTEKGADLRRIKEAGVPGALGFGPGVIRAASAEGVIRFFETRKFQKTLELGARSARMPVAIVGKLALIASERGPIKVWDLEAGREVRTLDSQKAARALCGSTSGKRGLAGGVDWLKVYDVASGTEMRTLDVSGQTVSAVAVSEDDKLGVVATEEGKVGIWDLDAGRLGDLIDLGAARDFGRVVAFTGDGFVVGTGRGVVLRFEWVGS